MARAMPRSRVSAARLKAQPLKFDSAGSAVRAKVDAMSRANARAKPKAWPTMAKRRK